MTPDTLYAQANAAEEAGEFATAAKPRSEADKMEREGDNED